MSGKAAAPEAFQPQGTREIITIGSRKSQLALIQTNIVVEQLRKHFPEIEFKIYAMSTTGDNNQTKPLHSFGAKSLWTRELEELMLAGDVDLIVHSLKDMPTQLPYGCKIGAILEREDPRDAVVMKAGSMYTHISQLPPGSIIGTSSVRRSAQLSRHFPGLQFQDVRGNIGTRLAKLDDPNNSYACLILASAGLVRLDLSHRITHHLSHPYVLHAVGQGALGVEIRTDDPKIEKLTSALSHQPTLLKCLAERSLMRTLEGGCSVPIGVETESLEGEGIMRMRACVASVDGKEGVETEKEMKVADVDEADEFGRVVARALIEAGAGEILKKINLNREIIDA